METIIQSDKALDILSTISLTEFLIILVVLAGIILLVFKFRGNLKQVLNKWRKKENDKEDLLNMINTHETAIKDLQAHHDQDMKDMFNKQLQYRQQSLDKQDDFDKKFVELSSKIDNLIELVKKQHEETQSIKRNELREKLLSSYRHYTSLELNPQQEWNEMESDAFWHLFKDYEELKGNGFIHEVVKPAMEKLIVVKIS